MDADAFRADLDAAGLLRETSAQGVFARLPGFEAIVRGFVERLATVRTGAEQPCLYFPSIMARPDFERTDYHRSFPNLMGSIHSFEGTDRDYRDYLTAVEDGEEWPRRLRNSGLMLASAACHPLYSLISGALRAPSQRYEVECSCFRHEPSPDPGRMQVFRQHEFVYVGSADGAVSFRDEWLARGRDLLAALGLPVQVEPANDPFFGRAGRILAANQVENALKYEILAPIVETSAIASANYHEDHFGVAFGITQADGSPAHTACIGFGLERITLALCRQHGTDVSAWPDVVRGQLRL